MTTFKDKLWEIIRYNKFNLSDTEAVTAILTAIDEALPDNKPDDMTVSDVVNAHDEGHNQALNDVRQALGISKGEESDDTLHL